MELKFELLEQDYIDFNLFYIKTSATLKRNYNMIRIIVPLLFFIIPIIYWNQSMVSRGISVTIAVVMSIGFIINYPKMLISANEKNIKRILREGEAGSIIGNIELIISEDGVKQISDNGVIKAKKLERIEETENYIFAFNTPVSAFIIPKRILSSVNEGNKILSLLYALKNN